MPEINLRTTLMFRMARALRNAYRRLRGDLRLRTSIAAAAPLRIVIGASALFDSGWIPTDIEYFNILHAEDWRRHFARYPVDAMLAEHVWEHLDLEEGKRAARFCYQYIRPGGYLRVAVPDGNHPDPKYIEWVRPGGSSPSARDHKVLYTADLLASVFHQAGFRINLLEYFDAGGRFHSCDWDPAQGKIKRSRRFDKRNSAGILRYTSIILDAIKPQDEPTPATSGSSE